VDIEFELEGESFRWNAEKAERNFAKHGVSFEQAAWAFLDPGFITTDAERNDESRDALIGFDRSNRLLFVVHIEFASDHIRLISARLATSQERKLYGDL
jgi:uncharacterized protein